MNAPSPAPDYPLSAQVRTVAVEPLRDGPPVHAGGPSLSKKFRAEIEVVGYE